MWLLDKISLNNNCQGKKSNHLSEDLFTHVVDWKEEEKYIGVLVSVVWYNLYRPKDSQMLKKCYTVVKLPGLPEYLVRLFHGVSWTVEKSVIELCFSLIQDL